jgi:hypothetical protein
VNFDPVIQHLEEQWVYYAAGLAALVLIVTVFRRWALPALMWLLEFALYAVGLHIITSGVVRLARWFKYKSTMPQNIPEEPNWHTPFLRFWDYENYRPQGILWFEIIALAALGFILLKMRPMKTQPTKRRRPKSAKNKSRTSRPASASNRPATARRSRR